MRYFSPIALVLVVVLAACGGDDPGAEPDPDPDSSCEDHDQCLRSEACIEEVCVDAPEEGDACPETHEGDEFEELVCLEGIWQYDVDETELIASVQPPEEVVAGQAFEVVFALVDNEGEATGIEGIEVEVQLEGGDFAEGTETTATTDGQGEVEFSLVVEAAGAGLEIAASVDDGEVGVLSVVTEPFDIVASEVDAEESWIYGEDAVTADGEEVAEITIELFDEFGNPVAGITPEFEASGEGNSYEPCTESDDAGISTCGMSSTEAGEKVLEITAPVEVVGDSIEFVLSCVDDDNIPFGGGAGSEDDPYRICTPEQVNEIGETMSTWDSHFVLLSDVDMVLVDSFNIIGDGDTPFSGHFDGRGFAVHNLTIDRPGEEEVGFFGVVGEDAVVENVVLENVDVIGRRDVGGLAGKNEGGMITESSVSGYVEAIGDFDVGGLVGRNSDPGIIMNSSASVDVDAGEGLKGAGGLVGSSAGAIHESHATGRVSSDGDEVGGLLGFNSGTVETSHATGNVTGEENVGGLVGFHRGNIEASYATGEVSGRGSVGGLVGMSQSPTSTSTIVTSFATGDVEGDAAVGGLAGLLFDFDITDSYATGDVQINDTIILGGGGLVGIAEEGTIWRAYATGKVEGVEGAENLGGFISASNCEINYAYWDTTTSGMDEAIATDNTIGTGVQGLATEEFDDPGEFESWDFADIWTIGEAPDGEDRPIFQWQ